MRSEAILINGIFRGVLDDILEIQRFLPEQIMFLQPYSGSAIAHLRDAPPSCDDPVAFLATTTDGLALVSYAGEIVGWDSKTALEAQPERWRAINRLLWSLQPKEGGLYDAAAGSAKSHNLLHVRRLRKLELPFGVTRLVKTSDNSPIAGARETAGGWTYVHVNSIPGTDEV